MCSFAAPSIATLLRHLRSVHSMDPHFHVTCGIDGCINTSKTFPALYSHIYRPPSKCGNHRPEKQESRLCPGGIDQYECSVSWSWSVWREQRAANRYFYNCQYRLLIWLLDHYLLHISFSPVPPACFFGTCFTGHCCSLSILRSVCVNAADSHIATQRTAKQLEDGALTSRRYYFYRECVAARPHEL